MVDNLRSQRPGVICQNAGFLSLSHRSRLNTLNVLTRALSPVSYGLNGPRIRSGRLNCLNGWNHSQCIEGADYFEGDDPRFSNRRPADKLLNEIFTKTGK